MGVVYVARDPVLSRLVAIKLIRLGSSDDKARERFVAEARAVASLRHPSIVTVYEYGDHEGQPFIAMEYVHGKTLSEMIRARRPLSLGRRLQWIEELCRGLQYAHNAGIVHRDIKPANIMVDVEGALKILDFGIAKTHQTTVTRRSLVIGTPSYMSPEQIAGRPATRRTDVFAVGLVLYELLSYQRAFGGTSEYEVMNAICESAPPALGTLVPDLDPRLVQIVDKAIEKDPERRFQDLGQLGRDLGRLRLEIVGTETEDTTRASTSAAMQVQDVVREAERLAGHLDAADRAFERGDFDEGLTACNEALQLDPENVRAIDGRRRAQAALAERASLYHLNAARQHFERGDLTLAEREVRETLEQSPGLHEAVTLRQAVAAARQARDQRAQALTLALDRARIRLREGAFESAARAAEEALQYNPADVTAVRLRDDALMALDQDRRARDTMRVAPAVAADAPTLPRRPLPPPPTPQSIAPTVPVPAAAPPPPPPAPSYPFGIRNIIVPPDIVAVKRTSPRRVKKKTPWRPQPDGMVVTSRAGDRDWFSDRVFVESKDDHVRAGFSTSIAVHVVLGIALIVLLVMRPIPMPIVKKVVTIFAALEVPMPVTAPMPATDPRPLRTPSSVPPMPAPVVRQQPPSEAAPIVAPPTITPEVEAGSPNGVKGGVGNAGASVGAVAGGRVPLEAAAPPPPPPAPVQAPTPPPEPPPVTPGRGIKAPTQTKYVKPIYPPEALAERVRGVVIVEVTIDTKGRVESARVVKSVPLLDTAALVAVRQWEFTTTTVNGVAVPVIMSVNVNFTMQ
jgi:TonB family protein